MHFQPFVGTYRLGLPLHTSSRARVGEFPTFPSLSFPICTNKTSMKVFKVVQQIISSIWLRGSLCCVRFLWTGRHSCLVWALKRDGRIFFEYDLYLCKSISAAGHDHEFKSRLCWDSFPFFPFSLSPPPHPFLSICFSRHGLSIA